MVSDAAEETDWVADEVEDEGPAGECILLIGGLLKKLLRVL